MVIYLQNLSAHISIISDVCRRSFRITEQPVELNVNNIPATDRHMPIQFIQSQAMPATQLLYQTALEETSPAHILIVNAHAHPLLSSIHNHAKVMDIQQHVKSEYSAIAHSGFPVMATLPDHPDTYDLILLLPGKNKQQTHAWMAAAMYRLRGNGKIIVACANHHGAKSYESALKQLAGHITSRSKSKCRIFSARKSTMFHADLASQWIDAGKPCRIKAHGLISQPGLFSWDRADAGSSLLMGQLPALSGSGMDLCCGYGLLGQYILRQSTNVAQIHLVETDRLALDCALLNTTQWQEKVQSHWTDATSETLPEKLDWIICNPPFHRGQDRDVELGQSILLRACNCLRRGGVLYLVANRKLPYERLIQSEMRQCHSLIEANGFKVIKGIK